MLNNKEMRLLYKNYKNTGLTFFLGNQTPNNNEFEKKVKYFLKWGYTGGVNLYNTCYYFSSIKEAKKWIKQNYFIFM